MKNEGEPRYICYGRRPINNRQITSIKSKTGTAKQVGPTWTRATWGREKENKTDFNFAMKKKTNSDKMKKEV